MGTEVSGLGMGVRGSGTGTLPVRAKFIPEDPAPPGYVLNVVKNWGIWHFKGIIKVVTVNKLESYWTAVV